MKGHDVTGLVIGLLDDVDLARLRPGSGSADKPERRPCTAAKGGESDNVALTGAHGPLHLHVRWQVRHIKYEKPMRVRLHTLQAN